MSPELQEQLRRFGWTPGRRLDDAQLHAWLRTAVQTYECHVFPEAVRIIREFGGLVLWGINIDPLSVHAMYDERGSWWHWEWEIGKVLFPIGFDFYLTAIAVDPDGKIYSEGIAGPHFQANTFEQLLENLAQRPDFKWKVEMLEVYEKRKSGKSDEIYEEVDKIYKAIKG